MASTLSLFADSNPIRLAGFAQGTTYHITYYDSLNRNFNKEIDSLLLEFDFSVSTYNSKSLITQFNTSKRGCIMDKYFKACMLKAIEIWKLTDAAFDPTVYPLVNAWGFGPEKKSKLDSNQILQILTYVGLDKIIIKGDSLIKKDSRVGLDFNAFAQGYSVDVVSEYLLQKGIQNSLVEIGGEVYARNCKLNGQKWTVGIEMPYENKDSINPLKAIAGLSNLALSTSGNYRRFYYSNGVKYVHHINPKTGYPTSNNLLSASVFAQDCITTDASATGLLVLGLEKSIAYLKQHQEIDAYLIYSDNEGILKIFKTNGLSTIVSEL
jgi:thiamine biosynthesis lipoprotein